MSSVFTHKALLLLMLKKKHWLLEKDEIGEDRILGEISRCQRVLACKAMPT